jgi:hypothetical protein
VAKLTIVFGILLVVLGIAGFVGTGSEHKTALIPAYFGAAITLCGVIALNPSLRMHGMHGAVTVGLLGFIGSVVMVGKGAATAARQGSVARPVAFACQVIMLVLTGLFVALCMRSFISARRNRISDAK